jgi:GNAT superfamily N-acetyltransferase
MSTEMARFSIRRAAPGDAEAAVCLCRRSITELCLADHQNDPTTLDAWLRNKTSERFIAWLTDEGKCMIVADSGEGVCGVGMVHRTGELGPCYVLPGRQRQGIGTAMLTALEAQARAWGLAKVFLLSTVAARAFYERHGYVATGEGRAGYGITWCYPYEKNIA